MRLLTPHRVKAFPGGVEPETAYRVRERNGRVQFEFMFVSPVVLFGTAESGWTDVCGATEQFLEWSSDGQTWQRRQFQTGTETLRRNGDREIWSISKHTSPGPQYARLGVHFHKTHQNWK
jgi:hypothetical protein